MSDLARRQSDAISLPPNAHMTSTGLRMDSITKEEHAELGCLLARSKDATQWWQGDWFNAVDPAYGEHEDLCREAGLNYETVRKYARVCSSIELGRRRPSLSFGHHVEVAVSTLESDEQDAFLDEAEQHNWSVHKLRGRVQAKLQLSDGPVDDNLLGDDPGEKFPPAGQCDSPDDDDGSMPPAASNGTLDDRIATSGKDFDAVLGILKGLKTKVEALSKSPFGEMLAGELASFERHRTDIYRLIKFSRPFAECVYCRGKGKKAGKECRACKGRCWLSELSIKQAPKEMQDAHVIG